MESVLNSVKVHAIIVMDLLKPIFYTEIFQTTLLTDGQTQKWTCLSSHQPHKQLPKNIQHDVCNKLYNFFVMDFKNSNLDVLTNNLKMILI